MFVASLPSCLNTKAVNSSTLESIKKRLSSNGALLLGDDWSNARKKMRFKSSASSATAKIPSVSMARRSSNSTSAFVDKATACRVTPAAWYRGNNSSRIR